MDIQLKIKMNEKLFIRDPEQSELGKKIILHSIQLIHNTGLKPLRLKNWPSILVRLKREFTGILKTSTGC